MEQIKIFCSYSHEDEALRRELEKHLAFLKHDEVITWSDKEIRLGQDIDEEVNKALRESDIILLLISSSFLSSFYCYHIEMKAAMERHNAKTAIVVPIILSDCVWENEPFAKLLIAPHDAKAIDNPENWPTINAALKNVAKELGRTVDMVKERKKGIKDIVTSAPVFTSALNDYPKPSPLFTGRENELIDFKTKFDTFPVFAIEGLGGTGKTEFVSKCIENFIPDKGKIIWLDGSPESLFDVFVESAGYGDVLKGKDKSDKALYSGFKYLIDMNEKIIFWDNFQDIPDKKFQDFLSFAYTRLEKAKIILITKTEPSIKNIETLQIIKLGGLEKDAIAYAIKLKDSKFKSASISEKDIIKICANVEGHPLAIELSMQLLSKGKTADDLEKHIAEYTGIKRVEEFSKRLFKDIFNHPSTTDEERDCFLKFSVYTEKVKEEAINSLYDGKDIFIFLAGLQDKLLLSTKDGFYETHPLIRSFSYEMLANKEHIHEKAANYYITKRTNSLNASLEEKILYHLSAAKKWEEIAESIEKNGRFFIHQGQFSLLLEFLDKLASIGIHRPLFDIFHGDIFQIKGEWEKAIVLFNKTRLNKIDKEVKTEGNIKYGEILFRKGNIKESLTYFAEANGLSKAGHFYKLEALALNGIGLVYDHFGNFSESGDNYLNALKIQKRIDDKDGMAYTLCNMGNLLYSQAKYNEAIKKYQESILLKEQIGDKAGICAVLNNIGNVYGDIEKYEESRKFHEKSLAISESIGNKVGIANSLSGIGSILMDTNKNKALQYFRESIGILKEIGENRTLPAALNNIGVIFYNKGKFDDALEKFQESLKIYEETGDNVNTARCYLNIANSYASDTKKEYKLALFYYFKSLALMYSLGLNTKLNLTLQLIDDIKKKIALEDFKALCKNAYEKITPEMQKFIPLSEILHEPIHRSEKKIGRNDPCPCNSGKKYKNCHGLGK